MYKVGAERKPDAPSYMAPSGLHMGTKDRDGGWQMAEMDD